MDGDEPAHGEVEGGAAEEPRCEGGSLCTVKYNTTNLVNVEYTEDPFAAPGLPPHPECDAAMEKPDTVQKVKCDDTLCESGFASGEEKWWSSDGFVGCRCVSPPSPPSLPPDVLFASSPPPPSLPCDDDEICTYIPADQLESACGTPDAREKCRKMCGLCTP